MDLANSPFAGALASQLTRTNRPVTELIMAVRRDVFIATGFSQTPWENSSLLPPVVRMGAGLPTEAPSSDLIIREFNAWRRIRDSRTHEEYQNFIADYPDGAFVRLAKLKHRSVVALRSERFTQDPVDPINQKARVLWVDDNPHGNVKEASQLVEQMITYVRLDLSLDVSVDTAGALQKIHENKYDVVISDMARFEDGSRNERAGYKLLEHMRLAGLAIPFIIYSSSREPEHLRQADDRGAQGSTNDPVELVWHIARSLALK